MDATINFMLNNIWISGIPNWIVEILPAAALILIGFLVERQYTSRISSFANAIAVSTFFYGFQNLDIVLVGCINFLIIVGIIAFLSYFFKKIYGFEWAGLPSEFYDISLIFGSIFSGLLLLYGLNLSHNWIPALI